MKEDIGTNESLNLLMNKYEQTSQRYIEAEKFIWELADLKWYEKLFIKKRVIKFIESRLEKYNF